MNLECSDAIVRYILLPLPPQRRELRFDDLSDEYAQTNLRFQRVNLLKSAAEALEIPNVWRYSEDGHVMNGEMGMIIFLKWLSHHERLTDLQNHFDVEYSQISRLVTYVYHWLDDRWRHVIEENMDFFVPRFQLYNDRFCAKYEEVHGHVPHPRWEDVAGVIDGTKHRSTANFEANYNGHKKYTCLAYMVVTAMDGMIMNLYGPMSGRRNDMALQNHSQINAQMQNAQIGHPTEYTLASDKGFYNETHMKPMMTEPLTPEQEQANHEFSSMRVAVEWDIGRVESTFTRVSHWHQMKLRNMALGKLYRAAVILLNVKTCLEGNSTSLYFGCPVPSLAEYLVDPDDDAMEE